LAETGPRTDKGKRCHMSAEGNCYPGGCSARSFSVTRHIALFLPYLLVFVGFVLRLYRISFQSIWWDEANAIHVAQGGWQAVLATAGDESWTHPPLHYGLLTAWAPLAGFSELSVRYPSLLCGVLLLPVTYVVGRHVFDRRTALLGLTIVVLSPLYVTYSQEARVYVLLPLLYLLFIRTLHQLVEADHRPLWRHWLTLGVIEALILYAHFVLALGILWGNLFLMIDWLRRRRFSIGEWAASQVLAVGLFVPWGWNLARNWGNIQPWLSIGGEETGPSLPTFVWRIWRFTISGNEAAAQAQPVLAAGVALLALWGMLGVLFACLADQRRRQTVTMLAHGLVPFAFCFVFWQKWPLAHSRYTMGFSVPLFLVMGRSVIVLWDGSVWSRWMGALLVCVLAFVLVTGLVIQTYDERFHKDDVRGVAAYLEEATAAGDVILVGPDDYSLPYTYDGPAKIAMARDEPLAAKAHHLREVTTGKQRLFLVHWDPSQADVHGLRPFLLEQVGRLVEWRDFRGLDVRAYALDAPTLLLPDPPEFHQVQARFGALSLTGVSYELVATTDNAVTVALRWRLDEAIDVPYKVVVMLKDVGERRISAADVMVLDDAGRSTDRWMAGIETVNFYVVPVPVGTPPLSFHLDVGVYDADTLARLPLVETNGVPTGEYEVRLGDVTLVQGESFDDDPYGTWENVAWETPVTSSVSEGLSLDRYAVMPRAVLPGGQVEVLLRWRAEGVSRFSANPTLRLLCAGEIWTEVPGQLLSKFYPVEQWDVGEVVVERRDLTYPPRRGVAELALVAGGNRVSLGQMQLDESALLWELPRQAQHIGVRFGDFAELSGYKTETSRLSTGQPFQVILYWQALNDVPVETQYTVFTQLLAADGHLIAQHDGPPAENGRPTPTWVGGEVIEDVHTLVFSDVGYSGPATLIVGLYDSATVTRVGTEQGQDHIALPEDLTVTVGDK
jgi:4-amino-4-deoxy-L-arabinose transferase-like glycosyltransferase